MVCKRYAKRQFYNSFHANAIYSYVLVVFKFKFKLNLFLVVFKFNLKVGRGWCLDLLLSHKGVYVLSIVLQQIENN